MSEENDIEKILRPEGPPPEKPRRDNADVFIHMRETRARKAAYVYAANRQGMKLTEWIRHHLDPVARAEGREPDPENRGDQQP